MFYYLIKYQDCCILASIAKQTIEASIIIGFQVFIKVKYKLLYNFKEIIHFNKKLSRLMW